MWKDCDVKCAFYDSEKDVCSLSKFHKAPSIKCLMVSMCYLLRGVEMELEYGEN
jgi:hypothetical protein